MTNRTQRSRKSRISDSSSLTERFPDDHCTIKCGALGGWGGKYADSAVFTAEMAFPTINHCSALTERLSPYH